MAEYDSKLRKDAGAYYTAVQVPGAQVRLVDDLLRKRLGYRRGFAHPKVITLDPAAGTGTYLLAIIKNSLERAETDKGAPEDIASDLAKTLYGFEIMVGPFAVMELRVSRALADMGAQFPAGETHLCLTDTLESPHATPPQTSLFAEPIAQQHKEALKVKAGKPVMVCIGNPPYDRHESAVEGNKARTGGWIRWGDDGDSENGKFRDFVEPAIQAGHGGHVKNIYNLYLYFWRWALWKVFESKNAPGPGVVSYITASSYLDGDGFCGVREHMRRLCDEIWIIDLRG